MEYNGWRLNGSTARGYGDERDALLRHPCARRAQQRFETAPHHAFGVIGTAVSK